MEKPVKEIESPMKLVLQKNALPSDPIVHKKQKGAKTKNFDKENNVPMKKKVGVPNLREFNLENDENVKPFEI